MNSNLGKQKLFLIYQISNLLNGKIYIGAHITHNINDKYFGSSNSLKKDIKILGKNNFKKDILHIFNNKEDMINKEAEIVNKEFCYRIDTYNKIIGGFNNFSVSGMTCVKDKDGNNFLVYCDDSRYLSGELVGINKNTSYHKGTTQVIDNGNIIRIKLDDPRYLSGELVSNMKGKVVAKDKDGNKFQVSINDPKYLSGELIPYQKGRHYNNGTVTVKDKDNNFLRVSVNDPRYLSGELVSNMKGIQKWNKGTRKIKEKKIKKLIKVSIDKKIFDSIALAALYFNTGKSTIVNRIKSKNFPNYIKVV